MKKKKILMCYMVLPTNLINAQRIVLNRININHPLFIVSKISFNKLLSKFSLFSHSVPCGTFIV